MEKLQLKANKILKLTNVLCGKCNMDADDDSGSQSADCIH